MMNTKNDTHQNEADDSPSPESPDPLQSDDPDPLSCDALQLDIIFNTGDYADPQLPLTGWVDDCFTLAVAASEVSQANICLVFVADEEMSVMHEQYKNIPGTTDVLTFDNRDDLSEPVEGDIVICLDEAARQASKRNIPARHEVLLYAVHGLMHLLGHDDHNPQAFKAMHAEEDRILKEIGIGAVFHRDECTDGPT
ncbi:rRNA maturation RNase YbeY [Poriferisphaera sp. WC338]|uniref:rRNA maturation RNase YbeY n=1 Tax=Poriferisphaera sp. WC338 TaxID=3425129 RepID=UPI003D815481